MPTERPPKSTKPTLKALLTGRVTPEKHSQISAWLSGILNPTDMPPSPTRRTRQTGSNDPNVNLALALLGRQYPEATFMSPTLTVEPKLLDDYTTAAQRWKDTGHIEVSPLSLPERGIGLLPFLDTLRHEYSHGMGLGDWPDPHGAPSAYDVGRMSSRLHEDIDLPRDRPPTPRKKGSR